MAPRDPELNSPILKTSSGPVVVHLGATNGADGGVVSSPLSGRLNSHTSGGVVGTNSNIASGGGLASGLSFSPHGVGPASPSLDRNTVAIQIGRLDIRPPLSSDSNYNANNTNSNNNTTNMTKPNAGRNKKRGGGRFVVWVCLMVCVVIVIILVEDEMELRTASNSAPDISFKGDSPGGETRNTKIQGPGPENFVNDKDTSTDDDLLSYAWSNIMNGQRQNRVSTGKNSPHKPSQSEPIKKKHKTAKVSKTQKKKLQPFPIIQYDDDKIPQGVAGSITHAADSLLCRESVVDYVINATDSKDECDGLKKAFTKNCIDDTEESTAIQRRRRKLQKMGHQIQYRGGNPVAYIQHRIHRFTRSLQKWMEPRSPVFMAEDEILNVWESSVIEVKQGWDLLYREEDINVILRPESVELLWHHPEYVFSEEVVYDNTTLPRKGEKLKRRLERRRGSEEEEKRKTDEKQKSNEKDHKEKQKTDEEGSAEEQKPDEERQTEEKEEEESPIISTDPPVKLKNKTHVAKDSSKPLMNLALPTTVRHVSEKMLSETLMLQQDHKIMKAVKNQTNITINEAQADAAASSKAVADAADMVSNVLNDPSSVEFRTCCASILNAFHENCSVNEEEELSDSRLFVAVAVIAVCGLIKSLIRHFTVRWLPEAAGCILVGVCAGYFLTFYPHHDISFDGNWFLRIMVPPIVFEAALSIDKRAFNRHIVPILMYAVLGTLMATGLTAFVVHEGSLYFHGLCETIPYPEALAFGALISSIDPIAVLSVLSNMGMTDTDTIYVVIFGESLLNDGVAIVLFQTLVHFLDDNMEVDSNAVVAAAIHFMVVFVGSLLMGIGAGLCCTVYYWVMHGCQTPLVEVLMFCCWALLPYYVCDGIEWSGIVAVVAAGFIMDIFVVGTHLKHQPLEIGVYDAALESSYSGLSQDSNPGTVRRAIFCKDGLLSVEAKTHIGFVTEIIATMMETAIFAYLGLFLFSSRYHWNFYHVVISIGGCCISRAIMIPSLSFVANWITRIQQIRDSCRTQGLPQQLVGQGTTAPRSKKVAGVIVDSKMQLVLWFAGLRGAMSFALVEHIPQYDGVTGEGTRLKSELKAMTSASIIFTVFVLGGATFYMMEALGLTPKQSKENGFGGGGKSAPTERELEMMGLMTLNGQRDVDDNEETSSHSGDDPGELYDTPAEMYTSSTLGDHNTPRKPNKPGTFRRQRKVSDNQ